MSRRPSRASLSRRELLRASAGLGASVLLGERLLGAHTATTGVEVNDVQSQLNLTRVRRVSTPRTLDDVAATIRAAQREGLAVSVAGGRHSMGGQQFLTEGVLLDMTACNRVLSFDREKGLLEVEGGIEWPELLAYLEREQAGSDSQWTVRQKQTGVDRVSIGGSLASNIHGRGLRLAPLSGDVESMVIVDASGKILRASRQENAELFSLAIGGYGLFGVIAQATLRLAPRVKLQRIVEIIKIKDLLEGVDKRIADGCTYGDCQYATDLSPVPTDHEGVFACYHPVGNETPIPADQKQLSGDDWMKLYQLARTDRKRAFEVYSSYYRSTNGQVYWSDKTLVAGTFDEYRKAVDKRLGTEVITEVYVPRNQFVPSLAKAREDFLEHKVDMTYGTIRFIEPDHDTFLAWAREPLVCIVCNLHVMHDDEGKRKAADDFRRIIDRAIEFGGRYFLTYHRWATRRQVEACYPKFVDFLRLKKKYDPQEVFQSDWYRHYKTMFADAV